METFLWVSGAIIVMGITRTIFLDLWERLTGFLFEVPPIYEDLAHAVILGWDECKLDPAVDARRSAGLPLTPALKEKEMAFIMEGAMKGIKIYFDTH